MLAAIYIVWLIYAWGSSLRLISNLPHSRRTTPALASAIYVTTAIVSVIFVTALWANATGVKF